MPLGAWVFFAISVLADFVTLIWSTRADGSRWRRFAWAAALIVITAIATYEAIQIRQFTASRNEARALIKSWPQDADHVKYLTKGERIGVVLAGLRFLEEHKAEYPDTYAAARQLVHNRLDDFKATPADVSSSSGMSEYDRLEDGATAMMQLMRSIAED